jgi:PAS domain S-box-containing protein
MSSFAINVVMLLQVVGVCLAFFIVWMAYRASRKLIAQRLMWMMLGTAVWGIGSIALQSAPSFEAKRALLPFVYIGVALTLWTLPVFAAAYAGFEQFTTRRSVLLFAIEPLLLVLATFTNDLHQLFWTRTSALEINGILVLNNTYGVLFWLHTVYAYTVLLVSTGLFIRALLRAQSQSKNLSRLVILGILMPWIANILFLTRLVPADLTPVAFSVTGLALSIGLVRYHLFDLVPIARDVVLDVMQDAVFILDDQLKLVDLNAAARRLVLANVNPIGLSLDVVLPELSVLTGGEAAASQTLFRNVTIQGRDYEMRFAPLRYGTRWAGGWMILLHDVTQARQAQAEAQAERDFALQVMNNMGQGLTVTNAENRFIYANPAYGRITGFDPADIIGKSPIDLTLEEDRPLLLAARAKRKQGESSTYENRFRKADGSISYVLVTGVPRFKDGAFNGSIAVITDLTEQKRAEDELRQARDEAMQASEMKSTFLATMSHELRTPLTAIMGYSEMQLMGIPGPLTDEQREYNERIVANSQHLLTIINQVLDLSKIEAGRLTLAHVPFAPHRLLDAVLRQTGGLIGSRPIQLLGVCEGLPDRLMGDPDRLKQIVINLVSNGVKFTEQGQVQVRLQRMGALHWEIIVKDTGIGIPAEALPYIFDEFRQVDASVVRTHQGTGLGLAIVRKLAGLMGGEVNVTSELGVGSTFTVSLPLVDVPTTDRAAS